jgi:integrase
MNPNGNANHPRQGSMITVEPIKNVRDIATIKRLLADRPRDLALFVVGINTALRGSDLLSLTAGEVRAILADPDGGAKREQKTGKKRRLTANKAVREVLPSLLATRDFADDERIFQGQRGPITTQYLWQLVKGWCAAINLPGHYGAHTLRKTWGYHQRVTFGVDIPTLMVIFGHATQRQTLTYLCIQPDEIRSVYDNVL